MMGLHILQFGRTGQVGMELLARGPLRGHRITALGRDTLDLGRPEMIAPTLERTADIDIVINGAAYTAVDKAESEPALAMRVNGESVAALAEVCAKRHLPLIHLSTDYVFDGTKAAPYSESDAPNPINVYGRSKLAGEEAIREAHASHIILRSSWVYSAFGVNFVKTMLRLGAEREALKIVDDQHGAPTAAGDIALACLRIAEIIAERKAATAWGIYNFSGAGDTTWRRFAEAIFASAGPWARIRAKVEPITTAQYPTPAARPLNSRLDCAKIASAFGIEARPWREGLAQVLAELKETAPR
jgi:dTDP-4-dehydrorhamnose reductase